MALSWWKEGLGGFPGALLFFLISLLSQVPLPLILQPYIQCNGQGGKGVVSKSSLMLTPLQPPHLP